MGRILSPVRPPRVQPSSRKLSPCSPKSRRHSRARETTQSQWSPSKFSSSSTPSPLHGDFAEFGGKQSPASPGAGLGSILGRCAADPESSTFVGQTCVPSRTPTCTGSTYMSGEQDVKLYMYDLSKGMARALGSWISAEGFDGVWHSGVVVFGQEYFFNGDLVHVSPGETLWGEPTKVVTIGHTSCSREALHQFIVDELRSVFNKSSYDVLNNNCNHFADALCMELCQRHIPEPILQQPVQLARLPAFQLLRPFLDQWLGSGGSGLKVSDTHAGREEDEPELRHPSRRQRSVRPKSGQIVRGASLGPAEYRERELEFERHPWVTAAV